ncbi:MAG: DNA alkylation repair protein [bacterium]
MKQFNPKQMAAKFDAEICALSKKNVDNARAIRRKYSRELELKAPQFVLDVARRLIHTYGHRWIAYELLLNHNETFGRLRVKEIEELGKGIEGWGAVDAFGRLLSGPAWLNGQLSDAVIHRWARSKTLWCRRAALVSTVALNMKSSGGTGDVTRTLEVCRILVEDYEDMVVKALSWALRALVSHDPKAVRDFLNEYEDVLAARVKREVRNKLRTGLKNPKRKGSGI